MTTKGDISDLDVLEFGGKFIVPLNAGYSGGKTSGVVVSEQAGGANRIAKKYYGTTFQHKCSFFLETPFEQDYFRMFIEDNEGKRFICHLAADRPIVEPYVVQAIAEWDWSDITAISATVSTTLEIYSARDRELDALVKPLYQKYGNQWNYWSWLMLNITKGIPNDIVLP